MLCNHVSRYHVAAAAIRGGALRNKEIQVKAHELVASLMHDVQRARDYAVEHGAGTSSSSGRLLVGGWILTASLSSADPEDTYATPAF